MTTTEAYYRVLETLKATESTLPYGQVGSQLSSALQAHSEAIARDPQKRQLYRNTFTFTVTSGTGSLATPFSDTEPLLLEFKDSWEVYNTADTPYAYQQLPDNPSALLDQPVGDLGWWWLQKDNLKTITSTGSRTNTASYTIIGNVTKTLTNITNKQYGDDFIATLVGFVTNAKNVDTDGDGQ